MIEIYRHAEKGLEPLENPLGKSWINVVLPTADEIAKIREWFSIPEELILSLKDVNQVPEIDEYEKFMLLTIRVPCSDSASKYSTVPVGVFVMEDKVMTVCFFENDAVSKIKEQKFAFSKTRLVFHLLLISARLYLADLKEIEKRLYEMEERLEKTQNNRLAMEFLDIQKELVYFATSLENNAVVIRRLWKEETRHNHLPVRTEEDKKLIEKVMDENNQAVQTVKIYSNILNGTLDSFSSMVSNNLNNVVKVLTSITILVAIPTMIASFYGMNVGLPLAESATAFRDIALMSLVATIIAVLFFWRRKFL